MPPHCAACSESWLFLPRAFAILPGGRRRMPGHGSRIPWQDQPPAFVAKRRTAFAQVRIEQDGRGGALDYSVGGPEAEFGGIARVAAAVGRAAGKPGAGADVDFES